MAKKYLSIEEAAEMLGIPKEELNRLRSRGDIRGFSDRGTFKFKEEDVEELGRRLQPSSEPDLQMLDGEDDSSVLDEDPASSEDDAPSIIRRLSAGGGGANEDESDPIGSIFDDFGNNDLGSSDSDVRLVMDERLDAKHSSDPDVMLDMGESDSDVRLTDDSDSDVKINLGDSDSDVRLASDSRLGAGSVLKMSFNDSDSDVRLDDSGGRGRGRPDSDSDVQLSPSTVHKGPKPDSDSDVMLVNDEDDDESDVHLAEDSGILVGSQSDSDVRLVTDDSDSDVRLLDESRLGMRSGKLKAGSDSDVTVLREDSGVGLGSNSKSGLHSAGSSVLFDDAEISLGEGSGISLTGDSGVALGGRSGISLDRAADSGVSLEKGAEADSGLSLFSDDDDDGITLAGDSGIALQSDEADDSGIALNMEDEDDGLTLGDTMADSGIALKDDDDDLELNLTETMPAMKIPAGKAKGKAKSDMDDTMLEVPSLDQSDEEESDFEIGAADGGSTGDTSVLLFDDEDETDDGGAAMVKKKAVADDDEEETFEFNEGDDEVEASADDDMEGEVFGGDEAFDEDDGEFGESSSDFETTAAKAPTMVGTVEYPWGGLTVSFLAASTICMVLCGMASIDLVRSIWGWQSTGYSPANGWLIEMLGGIMK
ncbi:MAG: helix-turn-helix domain-containing protein [Planctomycetia bacterium]|nr:helix-turn-helix domain-containing protein [Planctomycetia bacterium]